MKNQLREALLNNRDVKDIGATRKNTLLRTLGTPVVGSGAQIGPIYPNML